MKNVSIYPSASAWITPRANDIQLTTDNMLLIMPKPIANLEKVYFNLESDTKISVAITYTDTVGTAGSEENVSIPTEISTTQSDDGLLKVVDMSKYFLEIAEYKTLDVMASGSVELAKSNTNYYTRYTPNIKLCTQREGWIAAPPIAVSLRVAIADIQKNTQLYYKHITPITGDVSWYPITSISFGTDVSWQYMNWQFRVHYIPLGESTKVNVPKTNPADIEFVTPYSQQQQIVSSVGLGRNMQSVTNRTGVETRNVVRVVRSIEQVRKVGSYYVENGETWRLTEVAMTAAPNRIICNETWAKGWNLRSQFTSVNREFRSWNIPSEITQRNLLYQDYCFITKRSPLNLAMDSVLSAQAKALLIGYLKATTWADKTEITSFWIKADNNGGVIISCTAFGFGNSLVFSGRTKDNLSAGIRRKKLQDDDVNWQQNIDVYYCNADGTLDTLRINGAADIGSNDSLIYPVYLVTDSAQYNVPTGTPLFDSDLVKSVDKDPSEQLNFTYQLHMLTDCPDLIIGSAWAGRNPLVHQYATNPTRKYWILDKKLPQGAQTMSTAYGRLLDYPTFITIGSNSFTFGSTPTNKGGYCVTDDENNIIVAHNSGIGATFNMYYTHDYEAIKKAITG